MDFSLALFNRTGKYFIGRTILDHHADLISRIYYWRVASRTTPTGLAARIIGRLEAEERDFRVRFGERRMRAAAEPGRWLHMDPLTVLHRTVTRHDVVLCHDLGPVTHPELFAEGTGRAYGLAFSLITEAQPKLVFVSEASRNAMIERYGPLRDSAVIYPHIRSGLMAGPGRKPDRVDGRYILTVGSLGRRKNQRTAIRAFGRSGLREKGFSYVVCGEHEPGSQDVLEIARRTDGVIALPYVSEEELRWLYRNAVLFVLPSLLEGFGMPVAEAIAAGVVPVLSRSSVLQEVAGDGCITADPMAVEEMALALAGAAEMTAQERSARLCAMRASVARFSEDAFLNSWKSILAEPPRT